MFEALVGLFQSTCVFRQMLLQNKLPATRMSKIDTIMSYLTKITKFRDQLATITIVVEGKELEFVDDWTDDPICVRLIGH
jgi:hypothetical protein